MTRKTQYRLTVIGAQVCLLATLLLSGCGSSAATTSPAAATNPVAASTATTAGAATGKSTAVVATGTAAAGNTVTDNAANTTVDARTTASGSLTSFTARSDAFSIGYYVSDGKTVASKSLLAKSDGAVSSLDLNLASTGYGFTPVYATGKNTTLAVTGKISASDSSDGTHASDFTGLGSQIVAANYAKVNVSKINIQTSGFVRDALLADNHAQITLSDSSITTLGANPLTQAYKGYKNSANQSIMMSPPWVLGIQGGVRSANVLGDNATLSVINSSVTSGSWAVLSTDACSSPVVNVVDSTLSILPEAKGGMSSGKFSYSSQYGSGYGSYLIGNAVENFYGTVINGTTYAAILTGGTATYKSSNGSITLKNADGETIGTYTGKNQASSIDSVFGFMSHNNGTINVLDGTKVNTQDAVFLYKAGDVTFTADNATLKSGTGVLLQMMDNDDSIVGATNDNGGPVFNTTFSEKAGWPSENGSVTAASGASGTQTSKQASATTGAQPGNPPSGQPAGTPPAGGPGGQPGDQPKGTPPAGGQPGGQAGAQPGGQAGGQSAGQGNTVNFNLTNGAYSGNVYNGTGYYNQSGDTLNVTLGKGATLSGAISLTETRHVNEKGEQNTSFTIEQYYYLGHVANRVYNNSSSKVAVTLTDGATWVVSDASAITSLTIKDGSVKAADGKKLVMKIDGVETAIVSGKTYTGNITLAVN